MASAHPPPRARGARACLVIGLLALAAGCSAIVDAAPTPLYCEEGASNPCPPGQSCLCPTGDGPCTCATCVARPEQCNGIDDDCDGVIDNGLDEDRDGDGVPACQEGRILDCNDTNPLVAPGKPEVCNGYDDDCDLETVETNSCGGGGICGASVTSGEVRCLDRRSCLDMGCGPGEVCRDGDCTSESNCNTTPSLCTAPERCDPTTGRCVAPAPNGTACTLDTECASGHCYPIEAFGGTSSSGVCSHACCTDANCAAEEYCAAPGTGARGCLLRQQSPLVACARPSDCHGTECRHSDELLTFLCAVDAGGGNGGAPCGWHSACASNLCDSYCLDPCGAADDCPARPRWADRGPACRYVGYRHSGEDARWVAVCRYNVAFTTPTFGDRVQGEACASDSDCRDGFCSPRSLQCADTCCTDEQCPSGGSCGPVFHLGHWEMRCLPRD